MAILKLKQSKKQQNICIPKSVIKRTLPVKMRVIPVILIVPIAERKFHQVRRLPKQTITAMMMEKSQQHRPAQRKAQKLLPALSVAILKPKQSRQQDISILKSATKRMLPVRKKVIPVILIVPIAERKFLPVNRLLKLKLIATMTERLQQNLPAQREVQRHIPALYVAILKLKQSRQQDTALENTRL